MKVQLRSDPRKKNPIMAGANHGAQIMDLVSVQVVLELVLSVVVSVWTSQNQGRSSFLRGGHTIRQNFERHTMRWARPQNCGQGTVRHR
jgi:hypothetical protein